MEILRIIFPLLITCVAVIYVIYLAKKNRELNAEENEENEAVDKEAVDKEEKDDGSDNYMAEGMSIGMCLGIAWSMVLGDGNIAIGLSVGMMLGMAIGMSIKK